MSLFLVSDLAKEVERRSVHMRRLGHKFLVGFRQAGLGIQGFYCVACAKGWLYEVKTYTMS